MPVVREIRKKEVPGAKEGRSGVEEEESLSARPQSYPDSNQSCTRPSDSREVLTADKSRQQVHSRLPAVSSQCQTAACVRSVSVRKKLIDQKTVSGRRRNKSPGVVICCFMVYRAVDPGSIPLAQEMIVSINETISLSQEFTHRDDSVHTRSYLARPSVMNQPAVTPSGVLNLKESSSIASSSDHLFLTSSLK